MDLRRLEAFRKVYDLKSFSKAAQDLFLSQPTISAHIATLEDELGVKLFDRIGRGILPTQAADILYKHTLELFATVGRAREELQELTESVSGELPLGGSTIPANYLLPDLLSQFARRYPQVRIDLRVGDSADILEWLLHGKLVLGVVGACEEHKDLAFVPIMKDELVVVASKKSSLAGKPLEDPGLLTTLPWVIRERGSGTRKAMEAGLEQLGIDMRALSVAIQVQSTGAVLRCVQAGLGISVTSRLAASAGLERGDLVVLEIPGLCLNRSFYAVYHKQRKFFPAAKRFIEFLTSLSVPSMSDNAPGRTQCLM